MIILALLAAITLALAVAAVAFYGLKAVPQGHEYMIERFGKHYRTLDAGLHFVIPLLDKVAGVVPLREQILDIPPHDCITHDNVIVNADAVAYYKIMDSEKAYYNIEDLESALLNLVTITIRSAIGSRDLDTVLGSREDINQKLMQYMATETAEWGVDVTRIEIRDLRPPPDIIAAMAKQLKADREKRAEILAAEGAKTAEILRAEGRKQAVVLEAEGRQKQAEVEAAATQLMQEVVSKNGGDPNAINYLVAKNYVEALQKIGAANNSKLVMMPLDTSGVIGSLAGLTELAKSVSSDKK